MFRSASPYSAFFMSGLQSSSDDFRRRGSLPTDSLKRPSTKTLEVQDRSFLSLDLAESQSMKSVIRNSSSTGSFTFAEFDRSPALRRVRSSRDSLRNIPSAKPVPSTTLPDLPSPLLATITITNTPAALPPSPAFQFPPSSPSPSKSKIHVIAPVPGPSTLPTIVAPVPRRQNSFATWKSSSSVSTRYKRTRRSDALARLEGRYPAALPYKKGFSVGSRKGFLDLSDDEDDGDDEFGFGGDCDDDFVDLPIDFASMSCRTSVYGSPLDDDEDVIVSRSPVQRRTRSIRSNRSRAFSQSISYSSQALASSKPKTTPSPPRRRRSRTVTMFPLTSFIDLKADNSASKENDEERGWRSFIEISLS
ncbi:hypothetical protein D9758_007241 [Tetrapyrgos nigripes]|uniref:Uncharacterized protein n=1 Tax=Tetrapyrgos nigripes TaxID=182062 RepID=A0A8H5FWC2_9AGAR|nr:hypothetical protein D9758_007241 [Tetrapyrgos nigripes]